MSTFSKLCRRRNSTSIQANDDSSRCNTVASRFIPPIQNFAPFKTKNKLHEVPGRQKRSVARRYKTKAPLPALTRPVVITLHSSAVSGTISAKLRARREFSRFTYSPQEFRKKCFISFTPLPLFRGRYDYIAKIKFRGIAEYLKQKCRRDWNLLAS